MKQPLICHEYMKYWKVKVNMLGAVGKIKKKKTQEKKGMQPAEGVENDQCSYSKHLQHTTREFFLL